MKSVTRFWSGWRVCFERMLEVGRGDVVFQSCRIVIGRHTVPASGLQVGGLVQPG